MIIQICAFFSLVPLFRLSLSVLLSNTTRTEFLFSVDYFNCDSSKEEW